MKGRSPSSRQDKYVQNKNPKATQERGPGQRASQELNTIHQVHAELPRLKFPVLLSMPLPLRSALSMQLQSRNPHVTPILQQVLDELGSGERFADVDRRVVWVQPPVIRWNAPLPPPRRLCAARISPHPVATIGKEPSTRTRFSQRTEETVLNHAHQSFVAPLCSIFPDVMPLISVPKRALS